MKILFIYPRYPDTFWSFKHALRFISKKAAYPPLGALTVAALLPVDWEKRLVDLNVEALADSDIKWADYVFISAMVVQKSSVREIIARCKKLGTKIVAGGPLFTAEPEEYPEVEHLVLNEAEITLPLFLADLEQGKLGRLYTSAEHPDITRTPVPIWSLIKMKNYASMSLQYSRGCPSDCEFCNIPFLNGHNPRTKNREQLLAEMESLFTAGWRGDLFIVDDNFIGNRRKLKAETLPAIIDWMKKRNYPFSLLTEASVNLADDKELMQLMVKAGFGRVFVGIETPNEASLLECDKKNNTRRDLIGAVKELQHNGLEVMGGFIVGFDNDPESIFKAQIDFIQKSGVVIAMVGLLNAPRGTRLYDRLKEKNRLLREFTGDNTDFSLNFIPKMNYETLVNGYRHILKTAYTPEKYYERIRTLLKEYRPETKGRITRVKWSLVRGFYNCLWHIGVREEGRRHFWRLLVDTLFTRPGSLPLFFTLSIYGYHFRRVMLNFVDTPVPSTQA
jgi:radical SAM superfamily enzyme YgiQ (UPF0313 family)